MPGGRIREVTFDPGDLCGPLQPEDEGEAQACPNWTRAIPCTVQAVTGRASAEPRPNSRQRVPGVTAHAPAVPAPVTVSRTWDDARTIEQALALIVLAPADRKARRGRGKPEASSARARDIREMNLG